MWRRSRTTSSTRCFQGKSHSSKLSCAAVMGELDTGPKGEPPDAHSVRSSAVLAMNALGRWLGYEPDCRSNLGRGRGGSDTLWTTYASVQSTGLPHSREYGGLRGERGGNGREHGPPQLTRPGAGPARRPT